MYSGFICLIFLIVHPASKLYVESMTMRLLKSESCEALVVRSYNCCGDHYKTRRGNFVLA
jgi:UDP-glucose 4-epimerase